VTLFVITGPDPAKTSALAARYLHGQHLDGQFHADLRGITMETATRPTTVLRQFLAQTGLPATETRAMSLAWLNELWQARTAGREISVSLEDALSAAQVRSLLPGPGPALVVVTTRWRLSWMPWDDARVIET
jgi:hypothetical protein